MISEIFKAIRRAVFTRVLFALVNFYMLLSTHFVKLNFTILQNGLFDLHSVTTQAVSDGFFVMVKPLSVGPHDIHWSGILGGIISTSGNGV